MDFPQKGFYGVFELPVLRNAQKRHKKSLKIFKKRGTYLVIDLVPIVRAVSHYALVASLPPRAIRPPKGARQTACEHRKLQCLAAPLIEATARPAAGHHRPSQRVRCTASEDCAYCCVRCLRKLGASLPNLGSEMLVVPSAYCCVRCLQRLDASLPNLVSGTMAVKIVRTVAYAVCRSLLPLFRILVSGTMVVQVRVLLRTLFAEA
jgi:hypothetical protein